MFKIFKLIICFGCVLGTGIVASCRTNDPQINDPRILSYVVNPLKQELQMLWKDEQAVNYDNFERLRTALKAKNQSLEFAVNAGMFNKDFSPQGLYIEDYKLLSPRDTLKNGYGNFYLQPNGIFYLTKTGKASICSTSDFIQNKAIKYATQSGPMLLIDGLLHSKFTQGSANVHIRNGVGLLPNGQLLFAMSKEKMNFYDFASFFKAQGCKNALYLDGFVSRTYLPSKQWEQMDGHFGVIIAETKALNK